MSKTLILLFLLLFGCATPKYKPFEVLRMKDPLANDAMYLVNKNWFFIPAIKPFKDHIFCGGHGYTYEGWLFHSDSKIDLAGIPPFYVVCESQLEPMEPIDVSK